MPHGFGQKLTYDALDRLAEFLLTLGEAEAVKAGMVPVGRDGS
jgi:YD repeat-containing protein